MSTDWYPRSRDEQLHMVALGFRCSKPKRRSGTFPRHAPTVLTLFAPKHFLYSVADCYVATQNIMLAAHSLGVGSCMVARAEDTFSSELGQRLQKEWGIDESYEAKIHITLDYPADAKPPAAKPRKNGRIIRDGNFVLF